MKKFTALILLIFSFASQAYAYDVFIQVRFVVKTEFGDYSSAIFYTKDEYDLLSSDDINSDIKKQISQYLYDRNNPKPQIQPKEDVLLETKAFLQSQSIDIQNQIVSVDNAIIDAKIISKDIIKPSIPKNLKVLKFSDDILVLGWDNSTDETGIIGYKIFRDGLEFDKVSSNIFYDYKFNSKLSYSYQVAAIDKNENASELSKSLIFP